MNIVGKCARFEREATDTAGTAGERMGFRTSLDSSSLLLYSVQYADREHRAHSCGKERKRNISCKRFKTRTL